ncbi:MAG: hypothetical protein V2G33_07760 [bacterium JZ-2024 1]
MGFWIVRQEEWDSVSTEGHREGLPSLVRGTVRGTGGIQTFGSYLPPDGNERIYTIRIVTSGALGNAQFIWSDGASWSSPIATSPTPVPLSHGISISFLPGIYYVNDIWNFEGVLPYGWKNLWDGYRGISFQSAIHIPHLACTLRFPHPVALNCLIVEELENVSQVQVWAGPDPSSLQLIASKNLPDSQKRMAFFFSPTEPQGVFCFRFFPADAQKRITIGEMRCGEALFLPRSSLIPPVSVEVQRNATPDGFQVFGDEEECLIEPGNLTEQEEREIREYLVKTASGGRNYGIAFGFTGEGEDMTEQFWLGRWRSPLWTLAYPPKVFSRSFLLKLRLLTYSF